MQTVIETPTFLRHAKQEGISDEDRALIVDMIARDPLAGVVIEGTGGARKVRVAKPGSGKSGGFRLVTFFAAPDVPVFLLDVYGKGGKVSLTKSEKNVLAALLAGLADQYRKARSDRVTGFRRGRPSPGPKVDGSEEEGR